MNSTVAALLVGAASILASAPRAQTTVVSPIEFKDVEGPLSSSQPFTDAQLRFQQVDRSLQGTPRVLQALEFRRDGCTQGIGPARRVELSVLLSDADCTTFSSIFDLNPRANATTVVARRGVDLVRWVTPPVCPAAFDNTIVFDAPFTYAGNADLLFELRVFANSSGSAYTADAADNRACWLGCTQGLAPGCLVAGRTTPMFQSFVVQNCGAGSLDVSSWLSEAPASSPYALFLCPGPCAPLGGFCAPVHVAGAGCVLLDLGVTDAAGTGFGTWTVPVPGNPCNLGPVCTQYVSITATSAIYLSGALSTKLPCNPVTTACLKSAWAPDPNAATAQTWTTSGLVVRYRAN